MFSLSRLQTLESRFRVSAFDSLDNFEIKHGVLPVIISAPHTVEHPRKGRVRYGEPGTGVLAQLLHENLNVHCIYATRNDGIDHNYDPESPYRDFLVKYIRENDIRFLIDLHILGAHRPFLAYIGTGKGRFISSQDVVLSAFRAYARECIEPVALDVIFTAGHRYTVPATISRECGIDAIQLEHNWKLMELSETPDHFLRVYRAISYMIEDFLTANSL